MPFLRLLLSFFFVLLTVCAQPPEIVALTSAFPNISFSAKAEPLPGELLQTVKRSSWHEGCPVPPEELRRLILPYWNFEGKPATGMMIVNRDLVEDVTAIFQELFRHGFLIERMQPVEEYGASDDLSMAANNTSAFNCRDITGQKGKFSNHSWGHAIDINPLTNPYVKGEKVLPPAGKNFLVRSRAYPGGVLDRSFIVELFSKHGWTWGGSWSDRQDYQHFEKPQR